VVKEIVGRSGLIARPPAQISAIANCSDQDKQRRADPQSNRIQLQRRIEQDEIAIMGDDKVDRSLIAVARRQSLANQYAKIMRQRRIGIIDALILAHDATEILTDGARAFPVLDRAASRPALRQRPAWQTMPMRSTLQRTGCAVKRGLFSSWFDHGNSGAILALLKHNADQHIAETEGRTPLLRALENGNAEAARLLIGDRADVDAHTMAGNTPLILAAKSGTSDIVALLLKRHARTDVRNNVGYNALMIAAQGGRLDVVKALLLAGANQTLRNKKRETAADVAVASGHGEIGRLFK
jgi:Ankyrin repeats (3 copies)